jgi:hypothetical protein
VCGDRGWIEKYFGEVGTFQSRNHRGLTTCGRYESDFQKAGAKLWWEKVKAVKGKKAVSKVLDDIERAKNALVLAYQNVLR